MASDASCDFDIGYISIHNSDEESSDCFDVGTTGASSSAAPAPKRARVRECALVSTAPVCVFLLVDPSINTLCKTFWAQSPDRGPHYDGLGLSVVGLAFVDWRLRRDSEDPEDDIGIILQKVEIRSRSRANDCFGYVDYVCRAVYPLDAPVSVTDATVLAAVTAMAYLRNELRNSKSNGRSVTDICTQEYDNISPSYFSAMSFQQAERLVTGDTRALRTVLLSKKPRYANMFRGFPKPSHVQRFIRLQSGRRGISNAQVGGVSANKHDDAGGLLELPPNGEHLANSTRTFGGKVEVYRGTHFLKVLRFNRHLKSAATLDEAPRDAVDLLTPEGVALPDDFAKGKQPSPAQIRRARVQLDAVSNNVRRRYMTDLYRRGDEVVSAHLFSDGSPVTGVEIQGMLIQVWLVSNTLLEMVMPGVHLAFGQYGLSSKVYAFLWSFFLMCGPRFEVMEFFLGKIRSITTDMGIELGMLNARNVLLAFLRRLNGTPWDQLSSLVDPLSRLFRRAMRVPGWSHLFGNAMKFAVKEISQWPRILRMLRHLCNLFRNKSWRTQIWMFLKDKVDFDVKKLLRKFTAKLAKWRYETLHEVFLQLRNLEDLCVKYLGPMLGDIFGGFKDRELMSSVEEACNWSDLWAFLDSFFVHLLDPMEGGRRWGLVCPCHPELRKIVKRVKCPHSSRRLKEARQFYFKLYGDMAQRGRRPALEDARDVQWVAMEVAHAERTTSASQMLKGNWLKSAPWLFAEAAFDPVQAAVYHKQLADTPDNDLDHLALEHKQRFMNDLEAAPRETFSHNIYVEGLLFSCP